MFNKIQISDLTNLAKIKNIPISVLVEVCYICNENCIHCCIDDHKKMGMTLVQYETLFKQMVEAGTFFVILSGGEPFMRKDFMDIVRIARKQRLSVTIFTNGTLVTDSIVKELKYLNVSEVHISIYSHDPKLHDSITKLEKSFEKSVECIKKLVKHGITTRIKCPLMNITARDVDEIKKMSKNLGVLAQFSTVITSQNNGNNQTHRLRMTKEQMRDVLIDDIAGKLNAPIYFQDNLDCIPCDTVFNGGSIDPDGNVYVCNQLRIIGGNVLRNNFNEIWGKSKVFNEIRSIRLGDLYKCKSCNLFQYCTRCPGLALMEDGDLYGCSSVAKMVAINRKEVGIYPTQTFIFSKP